MFYNTKRCFLQSNNLSVGRNIIPVKQPDFGLLDGDDGRYRWGLTTPWLHDIVQCWKESFVVLICQTPFPIPAVAAPIMPSRSSAVCWCWLYSAKVSAESWG